MLKQRVMTGIVLLALFIVVLFWFNPIEFAIAVALMTLAMCWEWSALIGLKTGWQRALYVLVSAAVMLLFAALPALPMLIIDGLIWLGLIGIVHQYASETTSPWVRKPWLSGLLGVLLCGWLWVAMNSLFVVPLGRYWLLYSLAVVWVMDIGAYFSGRQFGKRPLCPRVSPKKTWEGVAGGLVVLLVLVAIGWWQLVTTWQSGLIFVAASLLAAVFSVYGDLFESVLKRHAGVKDSGKLLPGHGGVMDRMDGVLAALPVMAIACILIV